MPLQGAAAPTRDTQGAASLALGYVLHWAFSPHLLNPKVECILYDAKIVQTERRTSSLLERYAEVLPILCKDSANRAQYKTKGLKTYVFMAEAHTCLLHV